MQASQLEQTVKNIVQEARKQLHIYVLAEIAKGSTVRDIAAELGVTTQRVYQIKGVAAKAAKAEKRKAARRKA